MQRDDINSGVILHYYNHLMTLHLNIFRTWDYVVISSTIVVRCESHNLVDN